jgi:hypothetical protein
MPPLSGALIYGNGESRKVWDTTKEYTNCSTWGCNAAYRDCKVDNLVAIDYGIQQEIYESGYASNNFCWFADWNRLEGFDPEFIKMNYPRELIFETKKNNNKLCVVQGKEAAVAEKNYQEMMNKFPHLDREDVKRKCYNNVGLYITWLEGNDRVKNIKHPKEWCAGSTAIHLACQAGEKHVYMLGFDLSSYDEPLNNIYKGTDNYLPPESKGFNVDSWLRQLILTFKEFPDTQFYWVDDNNENNKLLVKNVKGITYKHLTKYVWG